MSTAPILKWDNGMSVGIEAIDNDHKNLIRIISELSAAIHDRNEIKVIGEIFERLENYIQEHFSREEQLMVKCNFPDIDKHIEQHRKFTQKIPELKRQLLESEAIDVSEEVNIYLFDWLINHILSEDIKFAEPARKNGLSNIREGRGGLFKRFTTWLVNHTPLRRRVVLTSMLPIAFILFLSSIVLLYSYKELETHHALLEVSTTISTISDLTHSLQEERDLTAGYISSQGRILGNELYDQRTITNQNIGRFRGRLFSLPSKYKKEHINIHYEHILDSLAQLEDQRDLVDNNRQNFDQSTQYYTALINHILDIPNSIIESVNDPKIAYFVNTYNAVFQLKESAALQRSLGINALEKDIFPDTYYQDFVMLNGEQSSMIKTVRFLLTSDQNLKWEHLYNGVEEKAAQKYLTQILSDNTNENISSLSSIAWFDTMTQKVESLHRLAHELTQDAAESAKTEINNLTARFNYTLLILLGIVITTSAFAWLLGYSIISPVRKITNAMKHLAQGNRESRISRSGTKDELNELVKAYEFCRINLLKADIADKIRFLRQDIDLKIRTEEREYFKNLATTDSLTGALNRREFNKIAQYEIEKLPRYQHPLSLMMIDLDNFKSINDTHGHATGDIVLKNFYDLCKLNIRETDIIARVGGEEFAILLPETTIKHAQELGERVRQSVERHTIETTGVSIKVTCSIGIAQWNKEQDHQLSDLLNNADQALYTSKNEGRNRVTLFHAPDDTATSHT